MGHRRRGKDSRHALQDGMFYNAAVFAERGFCGVAAGMPVSLWPGGTGDGTILRHRGQDGVCIKMEAEIWE